MTYSFALGFADLENLETEKDLTDYLVSFSQPRVLEQIRTLKDKRKKSI